MPKQKELVCSKCGQTYTDEESILLAEKWLKKDGYAPCPMIQCSGELKIVMKEKEVDQNA